jgi:hypothetical protein
LALLGVTIAGASSAADRAVHGGLYDSVWISTLTGDQGGVRIRVDDGPSPTVDFELCEGWCNGSEVFPAKIDGDRITFIYMSRWVSESGAPGADSIPVSGRFVRGGLMLKIGDAPPELVPRAKSRPR